MKARRTANALPRATVSAQNVATVSTHITRALSTLLYQLWNVSGYVQLAHPRRTDAYISFYIYKPTSGGKTFARAMWLARTEVGRGLEQANKVNDMNMCT